MPENQYFRHPDTQKLLLDILFVFCRLNPDVSYRQGMHELLAPVLWVVERDAIDIGKSSKAMGEDATIRAMFDAEHIEHDSFALFCQVMRSAKTFYEHTTHSAAENPMILRSKKIFEELLPLVDEKLAQHLSRIDIVPQVFLIRWVRLLFGREFSFDDMLTVWDIIFAEDPSLELVNHICLVMLLRMRWKLIEADYNAALTLLLQYPALDDRGDPIPQNLALDAIYLRDHMDVHGGSYVVLKHTGRPLLQAGRPVTPPALQRNMTTFTGARPVRSSLRSRASPSSGQTRNIESVLRSTAKNIYARGEDLGIGKTVKNAVDELHRRAQDIRDAQASPPLPRTRHRSPRDYFGSVDSAARIQLLEHRSRQTAKLLENAVAELWAYHKGRSENRGEQDQQQELNQLSIAIAKVQVAQVYLADPALPLPDDAEQLASNEEPTMPGAPTTESFAHMQRPPGTEESRETCSMLSPESYQQGTNLMSHADATTITSQPSALSDQPSPLITTTPAPPQLATDGSRARPSLEQSSFSWILDQQNHSTTRPFPHASTVPPEHGRRKGSLFGGDTDAGGESEIAFRRKSSQQTRVLANQDQAGELSFDLGSLRHGKGRSTRNANGQV